MNPPQVAARKGWKLTAAASLAAMSLSLSAGVVFAQVKPAAAAGQTPAAAPRGAAAPVGKTVAGGESTLEDKVMGALASREMDSLLEFYFKKHNIPDDKQAVIKSIVAWRELANPNITTGRKRALLLDGVRGVKSFLASTRDTEMLMRRANELIEYGMKGQINQIEYFGESAGRQAELNGSAEAVVKILDKAAEECEAQQNQVLAGQVRPNPALLAKWQTLDERGQTAKWTKAFASYGLALSLDPANPRRKETADAAITFLTEFEKPEFQREVSVKSQIGKLLMVKGDTAAAVAKFAEVLKVKGVDKGAEYEAYFFTALANLMGKNEQAAVQSLAALEKWVAENLKPDEQKAVGSGVGLLDYRVRELQSDLAKSPEDKRKFNEAGEAVLSKLMKDNPKLEPVIKRMLLEKLPADADITKLDTVLLRALLAKGVDEVNRAKEGTADDKGKPVIERAIRAAAEVQKRAGQPNVTEDVIDEAAFLEPIYYSKLGRNVESLEESLDYLKAHAKNKERSAQTLENALASVEALRKSPEAATPKVGGLIDRTWKIAVASGRVEYAFLYGKRLYDTATSPAQFKEAADALKLVPETSKAVTYARFYEMSAMQHMLDDKALAPADRTALVGAVRKAAEGVNARLEQAIAAAPEENKPRLRFYQVSAIVLGAELTQFETKDHEAVLKMLAGFEERVKGLPGEDALMGTVLRLRVSSNMALNKTQDAVDEVQKLVASGGNAANILFNLIQQMDQAYDKAKGAGDVDAMRQNAKAQVALIGPLIAQTKDAQAKSAYEEWEAGLLIRISAIETDAAKKNEYLTRAQAVFARQLAKAEAGTPKHDSYRYKLALISYELKDYKKVQQEMGQLIEGKLGPPDIREINPADGTETYRENPIYWEGLLRFMQSNWELSKTDNSPQLQEAVKNAKETIQTLYINRGKAVGGDRLRAEYAKLRAEMLPGWDETNVSPTTKAATQPAAAAPTK